MATPMAAAATRAAARGKTCRGRARCKRKGGERPHEVQARRDEKGWAS